VRPRLRRRVAWHFLWRGREFRNGMINGNFVSNLNWGSIIEVSICPPVSKPLDYSYIFGSGHDKKSLQFSLNLNSNEIAIVFFSYALPGFRTDGIVYMYFVNNIIDFVNLSFILVYGTVKRNRELEKIAQIFYYYACMSIWLKLNFSLRHYSP
jgi:hypothetical protein